MASRSRWGRLKIAQGASILFVTNLVAIILGAAIIFRVLGVQATRMGIGPALWVRRAVMRLTLIGLLLIAPLGIEMHSSRVKGQIRPMAFPLAPLVRDVIDSYVDAAPGIDVMLAGRSGVEGGVDVGVILASTGPVPETFIANLRNAIHAVRGADAVIEILVVQKADVVEDSHPEALAIPTKPGSSAPATAPRRDDTNVVLIVTDDLGHADLGCTGSAYYRTPNLDRLAAEGVRFTQAYAACAVCSPTRASIMTGRHPVRTGITDWIRPLAGTTWSEADVRAATVGLVGGPKRRLLTPANPRWLELEEVTVAELLGGDGYATGFIGKWHLGPRGWYPENQGFDMNVGGCDLGHPPDYFDPYPPQPPAHDVPEPRTAPGRRVPDGSRGGRSRRLHHGQRRSDVLPLPVALRRALPDPGEAGADRRVRGPICARGGRAELPRLRGDGGERRRSRRQG